MKLLLVLNIFVAVASVTCEIGIVQEGEEIKTTQEAQEVLNYILKENETLFPNFPLIDKFPTMDLIRDIYELRFMTDNDENQKRAKILRDKITSEIFWKDLTSIKTEIVEQTAENYWRKSVESVPRHESFPNSNYINEWFTFGKEDDRKLFNEKINLQNQLQAEGRVVEMLGCRIGLTKAMVIYSVKVAESQFYIDRLVKMDVFDRITMYIRAGEMLLSTFKMGGFIKQFSAVSRYIDSSNLNKGRFNIFRELYPQNPHLEEERDRFIKKGLFKSDESFAEFQAKYVLKKFIDDIEEKHQRDMKRVISSPEYKEEAKKIIEKNRRLSMPKCFLETARNMLNSREELEKIVKDMRKCLNKVERRSNSRSPLRIFRSRSRSPLRNSRSRSSSSSSVALEALQISDSAPTGVRARPRL